MGLVDKTTHSVECAEGKTREQKTILEKGSGWGSSWGEPRAFTEFDAIGR